jgi:putative hydrolase of the HAD superfamily
VRYTTLFFDVGETLVHVPKPAPIYHELLRRHGSTVDLATVEQILAEARRIVEEREPGWVSADLLLDSASAVRRRTLHVETILDRAGVLNRDQARSAFFDLYIGTDFFRLYSDVIDTLQTLRAAGYRLGIVSNWESRLLELCAAHGIAEAFDFAVVSEIEGYSKPHPYLYRRALELAGVEANRALHVGDKMREDVEGAAAVGIRTVLIDRTRNPEIDYAPKIASLTELPSVLELLQTAEQMDG